MPGVRQLFGRRAEKSTPPVVKTPTVEPPEEIRGVLDTYRIPSGGKAESSAEVFVVDDEGAGRYLVRLPRLDEEEARALEVLKVNLMDSIPAGATGEPRDIVADYIWKTTEATGLSDVVQGSHDKLLYYLIRDFAGFWEVDPL